MSLGQRSGKAKKIAAITSAILILLVVLFSVFFIAAETGHDCSGHDCPVCSVLQQCENTVHEFGFGLNVLGTVIVPLLFSLLSIFLIILILQKESLITDKVRLNN